MNCDNLPNEQKENAKEKGKKNENENENEKMNKLKFTER